MNHLRIPLAVAMALGFAFAELSFAQAPKTVRVRKVKGQKLTSPDYQVRRVTEGKSTTRQWFEIRTAYETAPDWLDEVEFSYFALAREKSGKYTLFRGKVTYVNVPKGTHEATAYLHPNTLDRFGDIERLMIVIKPSIGALVYEGEPKAKSRWWESAELTPKDGYIISRKDSPWSLVNVDNYEAIKGATGR